MNTHQRIPDREASFKANRRLKNYVSCGSQINNVKRQSPVWILPLNKLIPTSAAPKNEYKNSYEHNEYPGHTF